MIPQKNLVFRYDNTGHHKKLGLSTYPHHKHNGVKNNVIPSAAPDLAIVFQEIELLVQLPWLKNLIKIPAETNRAKDKAAKNLKCIACGSKVTAELQNLFDTRFGIEKVWNICRCTDCGIEQTIPLPCSGELKKLYEEYYNFGGEKGTIYTRFRGYFL